jgi:hypothetical protein
MRHSTRAGFRLQALPDAMVVTSSLAQAHLLAAASALEHYIILLYQSQLPVLFWILLVPQPC